MSTKVVDDLSIISDFEVDELFYKVLSNNHTYRKTLIQRSDKYKAYMKTYQKSDKYKAYMKTYQKSDKYKAYKKAYMKAYMKYYRLKNRDKILKKYHDNKVRS